MSGDTPVQRARSRARRNSLTPVPVVGIERIGALMDACLWRSVSDDPQFLLEGDLPESPDGTFLFEFDVSSIDGASGAPALYFDFGNDFEAVNAHSVERTALSHAAYSIVIAFKRRPRRIRFDPCGSPGEFLCTDIRCSALSRAQAAAAGVPVISLPRNDVAPSGMRSAVNSEQAVLRPARPMRLGAVAHVFYEDMWPEIADYLGRIPSLERVYVSITQDASRSFEEQIDTRFPGALVRRVPNRGRDVLPFLQWLEVVESHGIDAICKIHTKRSAHLPTGEAWRRDMLDKLLGSPMEIVETIAALREDPTLGIVGPGGHVVPSSFYWEPNAANVERLCQRMGRDVSNAPFQYVAGSMFWARVDALLPLRRLGLRDADFELESGQVDGTLAHALERCFPVAASQAGFELRETPNPAHTTVRDFAPPPPPPQSYRDWLRAFEVPQERYKGLAEAHSGWLDAPLISLLMPTYETREAELVEALDSVLAQVYSHWELCVADDASRAPHVHRILEEYRLKDPRIKVVYRKANGHISAASNSALAVATGEFVGLLDHDDLLHPLALHFVAEAIVRNPGCQLVYTDEDKIGLDGARREPYFKCELNYELLLAHNMVCHLACYRTERVRAVGAFREGFEGAQDYDLVLRFLEGVDGSNVIHVPRVLYHWRVSPGSTALSAEEKPYAQLAAHRAIAQHLERCGLAAEVGPAPEALAMNRVQFRIAAPAPHVSLVIPTRDRADLLGLCVDSILARSTYPNYSIIIVDNGSTEKASFALFDRLRKAGVQILRDDAEFNFSALNNRAVKTVSSEFVCLVNNDIEVLTPAWLEEMVGMADRPGVGAVGARLWYPDMRLQHGGVIVGLGGVAGHSHKYLPKGAVGYFYRAVLHQALTAVTAACLLIRRSIYEEVGGFDESLRIAFNDIDFCLRVRAAGYRNVWTPYAEMIHHESASRGHETTPEKQARFRDEIMRMKARWGEGLLRDPAYSPNLTLEREDFGIAWPPRVAMYAATPG